MEPNGDTVMGEEGRGERINNDEVYETNSFEVEEARKRKDIEYHDNATIGATAHEMEENMVITPKEDDKIVNIVEPNENTKMDEEVEYRNSDEDYETSSFEVEEARKRKDIEYHDNATIGVTAHEMEENMVITPKEDDKIVNIVEPNENTKMDEEVEYRNSDEDYETSTFEDMATSDSDDGEEVMKEWKEDEITSQSKEDKIRPYHCQFCTRSFYSLKASHDHIKASHVNKPTKLTNNTVKFVKPNKNTKMDEGGKRRNSDEDFETSSFEAEEAKKRRRIDYSTNATIPITTPKEDDVKKVTSVNVATLPHSKQATDKADVITPKKDDVKKVTSVNVETLPHSKQATEKADVVTPKENERFVDANVKKVTSVNVETLPHSKQATDKADVITQSKKKQKVIWFPCKTCNRSLKSEAGLQHHIRDKHKDTTCQPISISSSILPVKVDN